MKKLEIQNTNVSYKVKVIKPRILPTEDDEISIDINIPELLIEKLENGKINIEI